MLLFVEGGKPENRRKTLEARRKPITNSRTHVCYHARIKPAPHECSLRCTIPAPLILKRGICHYSYQNTCHL